MFTTPVAARTRSRRSVDPQPTPLSLPLPTPLGAGGARAGTAGGRTGSKSRIPTATTTRASARQRRLGQGAGRGQAQGGSGLKASQAPGEPGGEGQSASQGLVPGRGQAPEQGPSREQGQSPSYDVASGPSQATLEQPAQMQLDAGQPLPGQGSLHDQAPLRRSALGGPPTDIPVQPDVKPELGKRKTSYDDAAMDDGREKRSRSSLVVAPSPVQRLLDDDTASNKAGPSASRHADPSATPGPSKTPARSPRPSTSRTPNAAASHTPRTPAYPPHTPSLSAHPGTPQTPRPPTPARTILRADPDDERRMSRLQPRPPTPPRTAQRTPANGYPSPTTVRPFVTPKRPRSPQPDTRLTAPRIHGSSANVRPMLQTSLSSFFTPQPIRRPQAMPATAAIGSRTIAPLPRSRVPQSVQPLKSRLPVRPPATPRVTVPVPFGGRVGESTKASVMKSAIKPKATELKAEAATPTEEVAEPKAQSDAVVDQTPSIAEEAMNVDGEEESMQLAGPSAPPPPSAPVSTETASSTAAPAPKPGLAPRRPTSGRAARPTATTASGTHDLRRSTRRQPSYPSSLGSGPLARPSNRVVSNPFPVRSSQETQAKQVSRAEASSSAMDVDDEGSSLRSVSAPTRLPSHPSGCSAPSTSQADPLPTSDSDPSTAPTSTSPDAPSLPSSKRDSLSMPSRREGYADTARNLSKLNAALASLRLPSRGTDSARPTPRPSTASDLTSSTSTRPLRPPTPSLPAAAASTPRPRNLFRPALASADGDGHGQPKSRSIESLLTEESTLFRGVVAYVDVRNDDGADVGSSFVDMLRNAGARVLTRPTESLTHIIYKSGKPSTGAFWRRLDPPRRPHVVGLRWVVNSLKTGKKEDEAEHRVDLDADVFQKRARSMEPKSLPSVRAGSGAAPSGVARAGGGRMAMPRSGLGSIAEGRTPFAPKTGSSLKKMTVYDPNAPK